MKQMQLTLRFGRVLEFQTKQEDQTFFRHYSP